MSQPAVSTKIFILRLASHTRAPLKTSNTTAIEMLEGLLLQYPPSWNMHGLEKSCYCAVMSNISPHV